MSCHVGDHCQYVDAKFSPTGQYYIEQCLGPGIPQYTLRHPQEDESPGNTTEREFIDQINKLNKCTTITAVAGYQWRQASIIAGRP